MLYEIQLTTVAEEAYVALHEQAQSRFDAGQYSHPAVLTFDEVQTAMIQTLPMNPYTSAWPMAGDLSYLWVLNLNSVTIVYVINDAKPTPAVIVHTIVRRKNDGAMRRWLASRMDNGELTTVLQSLGIEPYLMRMQVNSRLVH